jgi:hypothetical protein
MKLPQQLASTTVTPLFSLKSEGFQEFKRKRACSIVESGREGTD